MGRLIELKYQMIELEKSEFHFMDDVIADMELTPHDVEITGIPPMPFLTVIFEISVKKGCSIWSVFLNFNQIFETIFGGNICLRT